MWITDIRERWIEEAAGGGKTPSTDNSLPRVKPRSDIEDVSFKNWSRDEVIDSFIDLVAGFSRKLDSVQNVAPKNAERLAEVDPKDDHEG